MDNQDADYKEYQKLVKGKNINPKTLLATDYLNHFNEIHMLLGMVGEMPDCIEDIVEWQAITYQEHFEHSVFQDKELAIEAYDHSPEKYRLPFEKCVLEMDNLLSETIVEVEVALKNQNIDQLNLLVNDYSPKMANLIEECSSIINSKEITSEQAVIDDYFGDEAENDLSGENSQYAIDALFD